MNLENRSWAGLRSFVADHNRMSPSEFFFHVGDIKSGSDACVASFYAETADIMGLSVRTVERDWVKARGWLFRQMHGASGAGL